jgi:hypothetical protein
MNSRICTFLLLAGSLVAFAGCNKSDHFVSDSIADYYPLQPGKYLTYRVDSSLYTNFGQVKEVRSSIIRELVDAPITDNLGRPSFRIRRLLRSNADTSTYTEHSTYFVTPLHNSLELIEDNLRFIKLQLPIRDDYSWNGNHYLPDDMYPQFGFNSTAHSDLNSWEYHYENVNVPDMINGVTYANTITIASTITDSTGFPPKDPNAPAFKTVWEEKYAMGIGLVSRTVSLEEFQPRTTSYPNGYYSGFAVKKTLIDHN